MTQPLNPQNHPQNQATSKEDPPSPTPSTSEDILKNLMAALAPIMDFHKTVDSASDNDLRMYWDIRMVQGKDTPFTSISGHSSFPGVLTGSALGQLPSMISREVVEKIAVPLSARLHDMTNAKALGTVMKNVTSLENFRPVSPQSRGGEEPLILENERNEMLDVMLPKEIVAEAAEIMSELKRNE